MGVDDADESASNASEKPGEANETDDENATTGVFDDGTDWNDSSDEGGFETDNSSSDDESPGFGSAAVVVALAASLAALTARLGDGRAERNQQS
ncbi:hypothetical protein D8S78_10585 [Natrialba swarupiae]|nr:hypothetical protein [Natrialba swarupiae]